MSHPLRKPLADFAAAMEAKLTERDGENPNGWVDVPLMNLFERLDSAADRAARAGGQMRAFDAQERCVDVANYAMMLWDKFNRLRFDAEKKG